MNETIAWVYDFLVFVLPTAYLMGVMFLLGAFKEWSSTRSYDALDAWITFVGILLWPLTYIVTEIYSAVIARRNSN